MGFPLPPELIDIVLEFIIAEKINVPPSVTQNTNLAQYATINRNWQAIIERRTFSTININTNKRLAEFTQFPWDQLSWSQRRSHIRKINLIVELESFDAEARVRYETEEENQRNSKVFTASIQSLFNTLSEWPVTEAGISLLIRAESPSDLRVHLRVHLRIHGREIKKHPGWDLEFEHLWAKRLERSYLQFNEEAVGAQCRAVPIITSLDILGADEVGWEQIGYRKIEPASSCLIASKLPRLHDLRLELNDIGKWDPQARERRRNGMPDTDPRKMPE
ncbi:uncharacterized protein N7515_006331 [Penicillium bovifimosum]|uniref:F-box domain-containing protein n=1 Tax=Penicillium bovifimosum TaxID=126998 RepID=A0A9W9L136_9EURO|nr:uncharacterized protein N7515_006331 [Penicillium bovifimosum]KAJ5130292.1 hypothetical protein N7515_006331 [Penicillium bovifimosum]